jgi:hypothetical protein
MIHWYSIHEQKCHLPAQQDYVNWFLQPFMNAAVIEGDMQERGCTWHFTLSHLAKLEMLTHFTCMKACRVKNLLCVL